MEKVARHDDGVDVLTGDGEVERFDPVVLAVHADDAVTLLSDMSPAERADLGAIRYSANPTWLHRDRAVLPTSPAARASWNYRLPSCRPAGGDVLVSYWMNRLQRFDTADDLLVTLNPEGGSTRRRRGVDGVPPSDLHARGGDGRGPAATAGGPRLAFAGAHLGWGFHEDGCRSGVNAAARLGVTW